MPEKQPVISREIQQIMFEDLGDLSPIISQANSARTTTGTQAAGKERINKDTIIAFCTGAGVVIVAFYISKAVK